MRPAGNLADGTDGPARQHAGVGVSLQVVDHLLYRHDCGLGGEHGFLLHAQNTLDQHVALPVGLGRVDDTDIGTQRGKGRQLFTGEGTGDGLDVRVDLTQARADVAAHQRKRHVRSASLVGVGHGGVAVFLDLQRHRPAVLDRIPHAAQQAHPRIASVGEDQPGHAAHTDELVVDHIRGHPHQGQVAPPLANDLVRGCVRDQVGKTLQRDAAAIGDAARDGGLQWDEIRHLVPCSRR